MSYGIVAADWYNGTTARRFRGDAVGLALGPYVMVRHANLLGSYRLPLEYIVADLGLEAAGIVQRLEICVETQFIEWDQAEDWIWVKELARVRLNLRHGDTLSPNDKRRGSLQRLFDETAIRSPRIAAGIYAHYGAALGLRHLHKPSTGFPQLAVENTLGNKVRKS
jgi:hypothetical protein